MWDVVWTDPDKELVGEHRAKKVNDDSKQKKKPKARSGRASVSTTSSRSSIEGPFSLFRGRGLKRINAPSTQGGMASSISSGLNSPSIASTRSPLSQTFEEAPLQSPQRASTSFFDGDLGSPPRSSPTAGRLVESTSGISRSTSNDVDSIFSNSIADTTTTSSTDDALEYQSMTESERMRSIIQILEETVPPNTDRSSVCQSPQLNHPGLDYNVNTLHQDRLRTGGPSTPPMSPTHSARQSLSRISLDPPASPAFLVPPLKSPLRMFAPKRFASERLDRKDGWKPSDQHNPTPPGSRESMSHTFVQEPYHTRICSQSVLIGGVTTIEEEVSKMANTGAKEQASILHELWDKATRMGTESLRGDGKEVLEMKRWMLSAMYNLEIQASIKKGQVSKEPLVTAEMVLILHESSTVVTYIAALHQSKQLYDLSLSTRSFDNLPNIRNLPVTSISADEFPIAPRILESVHSLSLPSRCPADALSGIVQRVSSCLKFGGVFNLTLIDPLPRAGTMGPRMRTWIEENLLHNLAKESLCMSPSTLFPQLLGEAGLRSKGSTLTTTKFFAMPQSARSLEEEPDTEMERLLAESEVKAEVRSLVGRMLWVEVWGAHITAAKWWWEDEACVRECLELGTFWEYHTIKGVKGEER